MGGRKLEKKGGWVESLKKKGVAAGREGRGIKYEGRKNRGKKEGRIGGCMKDWKEVGGRKREGKKGNRENGNGPSGEC